MGIQTSMGAHKLDIRKGSRNDIVDHTATLGQTGSVDNVIYAGRVCSLTAGNVLEAGITAGRLPFFAWSGNDTNNYPDVTRSRGMPLSGAVQFGLITAFTAAELTSTEMSQVGADITAFGTIGTKLTSIATVATATVPANAGLLIPTRLATDAIVGLVSPQGYYVGPDGYNTLAFYPYYVPGTTVPVA